MSVTDVKAKAPKKASSKKITKAQEQVLKAALEAAVIEYVPLSSLAKSPLNVRTIPYSVDSVRGLADSIEALGLLQNLIVHSLADGKLGVAAGGRRLTALQLLAQEDRLAADHTVMVKRVSDDIAALASIAENEQRAAMHPAEQIAGFRTLAEQGKTPAQIGDALGFGSRHVQRMLKLANLAPALMEKLAQDELTVEQCQALCLEDDPARQVEVFESVKASWSNAPAHLIKRAITDTEMRTDNAKFRFIGREAYEAAGGTSAKICSARTRATARQTAYWLSVWRRKNWSISPWTSSSVRAGHGVADVQPASGTTEKTVRSSFSLLNPSLYTPLSSSSALMNSVSNGTATIPAVTRRTRWKLRSKPSNRPQKSARGLTT